MTDHLILTWRFDACVLFIIIDLHQLLYGKVSTLILAMNKAIGTMYLQEVSHHSRLSAFALCAMLFFTRMLK